MLLVHAAKNWELDNLIGWALTFFSEQYGQCMRELAVFLVLPSVCCIAGLQTTGISAGCIVSRLGDDDKDDDDEGGDWRRRQR